MQNFEKPEPFLTPKSRTKLEPKHTEKIENQIKNQEAKTKTLTYIQLEQVLGVKGKKSRVCVMKFLLL